MKKKPIVIRVDGGICAQIAFVAMGMHLAEKFAGEASVRYDLSWYRDWGKDVAGKQVRNWDFPKAFPSLACEEASAEEASRLSRRRPSHGTDVGSFRPPVYVGGYPDRYPILCEMAPRLKAAFAPELDEPTRRMLADIARGHVCAVHVRRGDLAVYNPAYGNPASVGYFQKAVAIARAMDPAVRFLFFSDEPEWVRDVLLKELPADAEMKIAEGHGSDRGYLDLYLISRCSGVISSSGSFGVFGAVLSDTCRYLVMNRNRAYAFAHLKNVIYVNDTYREENLAAHVKSGRRGFWRKLFGR